MASDDNCYRVKDAPVLGENSEEEICEFIDKHITTEMPDASIPAQEKLQELVDSVQQHHHRKTCQKKKATKEDKARIAAVEKDPTLPADVKKKTMKHMLADAQCRFHYPRQERPQTRLVYEPLTIGKGKDKIKRDPRDVLKEKMADWEREGLEAGMSPEQATMHVRTKRRNFLQSCKITVEYKRSKADLYTNMYNSGILRAWGANMDIQFTGSFPSPFLSKSALSVYSIGKHNCSEYVRTARLRMQVYFIFLASSILHNVRFMVNGNITAM